VPEADSTYNHIAKPGIEADVYHSILAACQSLRGALWVSMGAGTFALSSIRFHVKYSIDAGHLAQ
jgi:hypothetical protein